MRNIKIVFVRYYSSLQRKKYIMPNAMVMQSVPCAHWGCAVNHRCITLKCPYRWAHFPIKHSRKVQWVHPFPMNFNGFRSVCLYFSLKVHFRWEHHILSMKGCHAIRPEYNCFISMIISVDTLCGFAPLVDKARVGSTMMDFSVASSLIVSSLCSISMMAC